MSNEEHSKVTPANLTWKDGKTTVEILWKDGHTSVYRTEYLRNICPCAECRGTHEKPPLFSEPKSPKKFTLHSPASADKAKKRIAALKAFPVGNYGIGFQWADGHKDGLYTFKMLREMCPITAEAEAEAETDAQNP